MSDAPIEAFGQYLVYERLGAGGMARVDRAERAGIEGFRRPVALKRMLPHCAANAEMVKSFVREARLASYLRHANVAQTYELGKVDDTYFIAMELINGRTLRAVLKHCAQTTGPMPIPISLNILNQICDALDYAHNLCDETGQPLGIIHRDVSPSNIIVDEGGVVKLIDFGIAKASAAGMQTMSGTLKGKYGYMAPEYIAGQIDARADLFAVGVIAHELLTNRPLFSVADDMATLQRVRSMPLVPPSRQNPNVPPEIDDIVMTALARDPNRRWQHATALRAALTTLTQRLGLVRSNSQVVEWIEFAFEQTKPRGTQRPAAEEGEEGVSDPSISIAEPPTHAQRRPSGGLAGPLSPDQVMTAALRPSGRGVAQPGVRNSGLRDGTPAPTPTPVPSRGRDSQAPSMNRTLLDGAAALHARSRSLSQAPLPIGSPTLPGAGPSPLANLPTPAPPPWEPPATPRAGAAPLPPEPAPPGASPAAEPRSSAAMVVVLVLLAAGLAAAGVYFALPYLT